MKKITNKTLGVIEIILLIISYISIYGAIFLYTLSFEGNGPSSVGYTIIGFLAYIVYTVIAFVRLWKPRKKIILCFLASIILVILMPFIEVLFPHIFSTPIILIINFIFNIIIIINLFITKDSEIQK